MKKTNATILIIYDVMAQSVQHELIPALYQLESVGALPKNLIIFGMSQKGVEKADRRELLRFKPGDKTAAERLLRRLRLVKFDATNVNEFSRLKSAMQQYQDSKQTECDIIHYLSLPLEAVTKVIDNIGQCKLSKPIGYSCACRVVVEKPFGWNTSSAKNITSCITKYFKDEQIYYLDNAIGKASLLHLIKLRKENPLLSEMWYGKFISGVHIKTYEKSTVEWKKDFYERYGAFGDIMFGQILNLLPLITMQIPNDISPKHLDNARLKALKSARPSSKRRRYNHSSRAQYKSYQKEIGNQSSMETFVTAGLKISQSNWRSTDLRLSCGKALDHSGTSIDVIFNDFDKSHNHTNKLTIRLSPENSFELTLNIFDAATENDSQALTISSGLPQQDSVSNASSNLIDIIAGDRTVFPSTDSVIAAWRAASPLVKQWDKRPEVHLYRANSQPDKLIEQLQGA